MIFALNSVAIQSFLQTSYLLVFYQHRSMTIYLNTYQTWDAYGGPEEGGWWYECGEPVQSFVVSPLSIEEFRERVDEEERLKMLKSATELYTQGQPPTPKKTGYGGYTFSIGSDIPSAYQEDNSFTSCFEEDFAESYPKERPHYC